MSDTGRLFIHRVAVEWGDCDPAGIVFFPNYFRWFDQATWRLFEGVGLTREVLRARFGNEGHPLVKADSEFQRSARPGDRLKIETTIQRWGTKSFSLQHTVFNPDGEIGAVGHETRVWTVRKPGTHNELIGAAIPREVIDLLA